jgi:hypothetical protein
MHNELWTSRWIWIHCPNFEKSCFMNNEFFGGEFFPFAKNYFEKAYYHKFLVLFKKKN